MAYNTWALETRVCVKLPDGRTMRIPEEVAFKSELIELMLDADDRGARDPANLDSKSWDSNDLGYQTDDCSSPNTVKDTNDVLELIDTFDSNMYIKVFQDMERLAKIQVPAVHAMLYYHSVTAEQMQHFLHQTQLPHLIDLCLAELDERIAISDYLIAPDICATYTCVKRLFHHT